MRLGGVSSYNYFSSQLKAYAALGDSTSSGLSAMFGGSSSSSSSLDYASLIGGGTSSNVKSAPDLGDVLTIAYQFSNTLRTSAMATQTASSSLEGFSADAISEKGKNGKVSTETMDNIYSAAETFAKSYNSSVNSLYYSPSYSKTVQGIEKSMRDAVSNNMGGLEKLGFSKDEDGKLSIDKEKFKKAIQDDPNLLKNVFDKNSTFSRALSNANTQAQDTRSINKAEISQAVKENYQTYLHGSLYNSSASSNTFSSMSYLFNSLA